MSLPEVPSSRTPTSKTFSLSRFRLLPKKSFDVFSLHIMTNLQNPRFPFHWLHSFHQATCDSLWRFYTFVRIIKVQPSLALTSSELIYTSKPQLNLRFSSPSICCERLHIFPGLQQWQYSFIPYAPCLFYLEVAVVMYVGRLSVLFISDVLVFDVVVMDTQ